MALLDAAGRYKLVRNAEKAKVPVMAVVGAKEAESRSLSIRTYADGDIGAFALDDVCARVAAANVARSAAF